MTIYSWSIFGEMIGYPSRSGTHIFQSIPKSKKKNPWDVFLGELGGIYWPAPLEDGFSFSQVLSTSCMKCPTRICNLLLGKDAKGISSKKILPSGGPF